LSRISRSTLAAVLGALSLAVVAAARGADAAGAEPCSNFAQVAPALYRGAQPSERCLDRLATLGVRTVIDLRNDGGGPALEKTDAGGRGMRYVNLPMSPYRRPSMDEVRDILALVGEPGNQPVFVHCKRRGDRTGVIVAAYRMLREGWPTERALQEARRFGLGWWQVRMKGFIRDFPGELPAGASPPEGQEEHP